MQHTSLRFILILKTQHEVPLVFGDVLHREPGRGEQLHAFDGPILVLLQFLERNNSIQFSLLRRVDCRVSDIIFSKMFSEDSVSPQHTAMTSMLSVPATVWDQSNLFSSAEYV